MIRVCAYIDGFNLYHAIDALGDHRLKWLDLKALIKNFTDPSVHRIDNVFYFSAFAEWLHDPKIRHQAYVTALKSTGVTPIMGNFKEKERGCNKCGARWKGHEEKETDVNIALSLLDGAYQNLYDQAIIVSRDSDLAPALRMVKERFPAKKLKIVTPPGLRHSKEMGHIVGSKNLSTINLLHVQRCQLPDDIYGADGKLATQRPPKYR